MTGQEKIRNMNILEKIIAYKKPLLERQKQEIPVAVLQDTPAFHRKTISLKQALTQPESSGIIAEFKRKSPSKPNINLTADVQEVTKGYEQAGAVALSILTDTHFFGGTNQDIVKVREQVNIPILRKDFMFDPYQIFEAKSIGADAVLLIGEVLSETQVSELASLAKQLGLDVLLEVHSAEVLHKITADVDIIGVNNRNLKTFEVSIQNSIQMAKYLPDDMVRISESGIHHPQDIKVLKNAGFQGFLIGELFMKTSEPGQACRQFIKEIN